MPSSRKNRTPDWPAAPLLHGETAKTDAYVLLVGGSQKSSYLWIGSDQNLPNVTGGCYGTLSMTRLKTLLGKAGFEVVRRRD